MSCSFHEIADGSRLLGYVAIDSTVAGRSRGGLRIAHDLGQAEVRATARAMTLKYGLLGLPQGGAKGGVIGDADAPPAEKRRMLQDFARAAGPILRQGLYRPEADLGTSAADIRWMMESAGIPVGPREWRANRSGDHTARSCLASALALLERQGRSLQGCTAAIEGFGKVGSALALLLRDRGAKVVAISTSRGALHRTSGLDVAHLVRRAAAVGSAFVEREPERIERAALLELPVDLLFPCARFGSIAAGNVERITATAICAGANGPVSRYAEGVLFARGIAYPPDFLTNCGGVLGGTLEFAGVGFDRTGHFVEAHVHRLVADLLDRGERLGVPPRGIAEAEALARHAALQTAAESPTVVQRLVSLGIEAYRRGWVPAKVVSMVATRYLAGRAA